ncbi:MAG: argininosuccinate lyase [Clostridiales bacterium]|nr:argininosuccinate lyase [Clostridiales bacterium]
MEKLWTGRFSEALDKAADEFNASIRFDSKMVRQDITGSMAHAAMLGATHILPKEDSETIIQTLAEILADIESGKTAIDMSCEDIHMFVEQELTARIGDLGKKLHTARSRNDQVALDLRLYLRDECAEIMALLKDLLAVLCDKAEETSDALMPGYTHLQRAQPVTMAHHLLAYGMMFSRDLERLQDAVRRMNVSPLGSCALAGTTFPTDRALSAAKLGFDGVMLNSMDGVSDRDFVVELLSDFALIMTHLSRFCEELILYSSWEFKFIELSDAFTTGSSIMPQKKNPDMAELIRGKTGRVYGDLMAMLTVLKGLPLAYNKDMQEDKEAIFDGVKTVKDCLAIFAPMLASMSVYRENMLRAAKGGFINATDLADYLTKKGVPFRSAYKTVGQIVAACIQAGKTLEDMTIDEYQAYDAQFESDLYEAIAIPTCVAKRNSLGGASPDNIKIQIDYIKSKIEG